MGTNFYFVEEAPSVVRHSTEASPIFKHNTSNLFCDYWEQSDYGLHIGKRSVAGPFCWQCRRTLCAEGEAGIHFSKSTWFDQCAICGATSNKSACSFTWAVDPFGFLEWADTETRPLVKDEYGKKFTPQEFLKELKESCPIRYYHSIGERFS